MEESGSAISSQSIPRLYASHLTLPNPTDVRDENVKYSAVMYFDVLLGPELGSESL